LEMTTPYTVGVIVPTGVGAAIGGYAGDALPVVRAIAQVADRVITHPNVMNGASLYWNLPNVLYVEGFGIDQFAAGTWGLQPVRQNRIGLLLDRGIEADLRWRHLQVADAARATLGLDLTDYVLTDEALQVELRSADSGATWGTIGNPDSLLRAAAKLIELGATAIAVVVRFPETDDVTALQAYRHGQGVDPLAGAEAVISHLLVRQFQIPCAHAPALSPLPLDPRISPRSAAEELGYTFLPCVLAGLSRAPQFTQQPQQGIWAEALDALVIPASCCGGSAVLSLSQTKTQIITVEENSTRMQVYPRDLGLQTIAVRSYLEAIGVLVTQRAGITATALQAAIAPIQPRPDSPPSLTVLRP
jgi:Protein of unknown function (DUF3326)